jgi:hypothetical protein
MVTKSKTDKARLGGAWQSHFCPIRHGKRNQDYNEVQVLLDRLKSHTTQESHKRREEDEERKALLSV